MLENKIQKNIFDILPTLSYLSLYDTLKVNQMEITYQLFESENLFVQKYSGVFSFEEYQKYTRYITASVASKPIKNVLIDFRGLI